MPIVSSEIAKKNRSLRTRLTKGGILIVTIALFLLGTEGLTRYQHFGWRGLVLFWRYSPRLLGSSQFIEPSSNPRIRWQLKPGERGYLNGVEIQISSQGLRDREYSPAKPLGTYRIVVLGDSFTFGFGVPVDQTYPERLERRFNSDFPDRRFEVLNFGSGGYGTVDEVELLKTKAISFEPDLVILGLNLNDLYGNLDFLGGKLAGRPQTLPPHPVKRIKQSLYYFLVNESFFFGFLKQRHLKHWVDRGPSGLKKPKLLKRLEASPEAWDILDQEFEKLAEITRAQGIPVLLLILHDLDQLDGKRYPFKEIHGGIARLGGEKYGFFVLDFFPYFEGKREDGLWIYPTDHHPNARAHQIYAEAIYEVLTQQIFPATIDRGNISSAGPIPANEK